MERVLKTWALVFLFILFWGSVRTGLYANAVYVCGQAYTCGCMWLFAHSQKPEEDCEHRDLSSFILSLWSRVSHWSQSHTSGQQASVILLFLPFHSPGVTGKCVHTQFFLQRWVEFKLRSLCSQSKQSYPLSHLRTLKNYIFPREIDRIHHVALHLQAWNQWTSHH